MDHLKIEGIYRFLHEKKTLNTLEGKKSKRQNILNELIS